MKNSVYPALLNKRARIFASLNRQDLIILGCNYLILSKMGVSGIQTLLISVLVLAVSKIFQGRVELGFFRNIFSRRIIKWNGSLNTVGRSYE
ncbi:hypothetical protein [Halobacteriovorax sp. HLS]|uniref:hypothetical protein n=1 Tax=Halobacteriovorax sp. HLS TaxID=2234000 RepID=UPI000FDA6FB4|nr:hypothetical protein [Halobacteriovorax sp. HLS]